MTAKKCDVLVTLSVFGFSADNPKACQIASHVGTSGFRFCRFCLGKKTEPLVVRELRSFSQTLRFQRKIAKTDVATKKSRRVKQYGVILARNSFQKIKNFDPNKHTYEDLLHWFALGLTKYLALEAKKILERQRR